MNDRLKELSEQIDFTCKHRDHLVSEMQRFYKLIDQLQRQRIDVDKKLCNLEDEQRLEVRKVIAPVVASPAVVVNDVAPVVEEEIVTEPTEVDPRTLLAETVCEYFDVPIREVLRGRSKEQRYTKPRRIIMWYMYHKLNSTFPKISKYFIRDTGTVQQQVRKVETERGLYNDVSSAMKTLDNLLTIKFKRHGIEKIGSK